MIRSEAAARMYNIPDGTVCREDWTMDASRCAHAALRRLVLIGVAVVALQSFAPPVPAVAASTSTPSPEGYWLVASDGGVFGYGDAGFYGSKGAGRHKKQVVSILATRTGEGYWLVASDGTVASYGDAGFRNTHTYSHPIIGMALTPTGQGVWLAANDGTVATQGDAPTYASPPPGTAHPPMVGIAGLRS